MSKYIRWNIEKVKKFIEENSECELLSKEYINNSTKMKFKCKCGNEFETTFNNFRGSKNNHPKKQCNDCGKNIRNKAKLKYDIEYVRKFIKNNNCELISKNYNNVNETLEIKCSCGNIFYTTFSHFKNDNQRQCNECGYSTIGNKLSFTYEQVKSFIEIESKSNCKLLSKEYRKQEQKLKIKCKCGNIFKTSFKEFKQMNKRQCNVCGYANGGMESRLQIEDIKDMLKKEDYHLLDVWVEDNKTNIKIKCPNGHTYKTIPAYFKSGTRCDKCNISKGEKKIEDWLNIHNLKFKQQYTFKNLKTTKYTYLRFDFATFNIDNSLKYLIEYDGELHYKPIKYFGGETTLLKGQQRDKMKNNYCKQNNIKLLRIPYWEFNNIENILESILL